MNKNETTISDVRNSFIYVYNKIADGISYKTLLIMLTIAAVCFVMWLFFFKEEEVTKKISDVNGDISSAEFYLDEECKNQVNSLLIESVDKIRFYKIFLRKYLLNKKLYIKQMGYECTNVENDITTPILACKEGDKYDACDEKWHNN